MKAEVLTRELGMDVQPKDGRHTSGYGVLRRRGHCAESLLYQTYPRPSTEQQVGVERGKHHVCYNCDRQPATYEWAILQLSNQTGSTLSCEHALQCPDQPGTQAPSYQRRYPTYP